MKTYTLRLYVDSAGEHRWRMRAKNGRIVASSAEGYRTRQGAYRAALRLLNADLVLAVKP